MHEWLTGTGRTATTTQTAGPPVAGEVLQNQTASKASNGIALHPNTTTGAKTEQHNKQSQGQLQIKRTKKLKPRRGTK